MSIAGEGHRRAGNKEPAYNPVVDSHATVKPLLVGIGHDAELTGHAPEAIGHDQPEYALRACASAALRSPTRTTVIDRRIGATSPTNTQPTAKRGHIAVNGCP